VMPTAYLGFAGEKHYFAGTAYNLFESKFALAASRQYDIDNALGLLDFDDIKWQNTASNAVTNDLALISIGELNTKINCPGVKMLWQKFRPLVWLAIIIIVMKKISPCYKK